MMTNRQAYVRTVLNLYAQMPGAALQSPVRDRALADHFFDRQIPIDIVETALLLGSTRRIFRWPPPVPIRSLAYFESIVEELLAHLSPPDCFKTPPADGIDDAGEYDPEPPF